MKSILCAGALALLSSYAFAQSSDFTLIKEIPKTHMPNYAQIREHEGGAYITYIAKTTSNQLWMYTANITPEGVFVPISSINASSMGNVFSKDTLLVLGGLQGGRVATYNQNTKSIYVKVANTQTGKEEGVLAPDASPIAAYEKLPWEPLSFNDKGAPLSWTHSLVGDDMIPFKDHIVLKILTNNAFKRYYNPAIVNYNTPNKLNVIVPDFPTYNTEDSEDKSTWSYYGSTEKLHVYAKGYRKQSKKKGIDSCVNIIAAVDSRGNVVNSFIINMNMPGLKIYNMDKKGLGRMGGLVCIGETAIWVDEKLSCVFAIANAKDKSGDDMQVVKRFGLDGQLIWESASKVDGINWGHHIVFGNKLRMDAGDGMNFLDLNTGAFLMKKDSKKTEERIYDELDKVVVVKLQQFMDSHKDHKKILDYGKLNDSENFIAFSCANGTIKLYKFGNGS